MCMRIFSASSLPLYLLSWSLLSISQHTLAGSEIENLSVDLRALLRKEMLALETGMQSMVPAYVRGDYDSIADLAQKMRDSYIQRQEITPEQMSELRNKLPDAFTEKDKQFHRLASNLVKAAEERNTESVSYYHHRLLESCLACHQEYALHRFPSLKTNNDH